MMTMLDNNQKSVHTKFQNSTWLNNQKNVEQVIDWTTFYRRNLPAFVEHYLKISLHFYQVICLYLLNIFGSLAIIASRASAKSFMIAVFACAKAILYPGSLIVIASSTKKQASLIVSEKIEKILMKTSPNLRREIKKITTNGNHTEVLFKNGSSITVVVGDDRARGYRSTMLIFEEFRQIKKSVVDSVLIPFQMIRDCPFKRLPDYIDNDSLDEEPVSAYISSSGTTSDWMWQLSKDFMKEHYEQGTAAVLCMDYAIALKHRIKSKKTLKSDKMKVDPITWRIEYENEMLRENLNSFFTYDMLAKNQIEKNCFYPHKLYDVINGRKNPYNIPKQTNEIRILSCDIAFVDKKNNDNSVFTCIRLLPESVEYKNNQVDGVVRELKQGYRRIVPYIEVNKGTDIDKQAIRIKQLFTDFQADYLVLDTRNGGILLADRLAKVLYDEERDVEYPAWSCMNDESITRVKVAGALPILYAINATLKLNSDIAIAMQEVLVSKRINLLINYNIAQDELLPKIDEYVNAPDAETLTFYENPYLQTQALISEMVSLEYEKGTQTGVFKIHEKGTNTKDRYTSLSYGNYFASLLEQDLLSSNEQYDYAVLVN